MKLVLTEEILTKAYQCTYAKCSSTKRIVYILVVPTLIVALVIGIARGWLDIVDIILNVLLALMMSWELAEIIFREALWKRTVTKMFDLTDTIDMEVNWWEEKVEIGYGRVCKTLPWYEFKGWRETNGLLLLYRCRKFCDMSDRGLIDAIDLSQVSEEDRTSFRKMLGGKVKRLAPLTG